MNNQILREQVRMAQQPSRRKGHRWRALQAMLVAALGGSVLIPTAAVAVRLRPRGMPRIQRQVHSWMCRALRIHIDTLGTPAAGQVLYVANHISWSDIVVLGSRILGSFVAKAEVETWPIFGWLADLQRTIYVKREARHKASEQSNAIVERLREGANIILFPEGTSSEGNMVLPFKTSLFSITDTPGLEHLWIQPVTITYTHLNGLPMLRAQRPNIAWIGDMDFGRHAYTILGIGRMRALIQYHAPVRRADFPDRKALARHCEKVIAEGIFHANAGRLPVQLPR